MKSLRKTLKEKNQELYNRLDEIENLAKSLLTYTASKFPYYTPHNFQHSLNVEENLNWLIPDEKKMELNSHELFFLIISSWLHDWGMVGSADEDPEEIRENHHARTEENFEKQHDRIRLSLNEARIVGRICLGHRKENLLDPKFDDLFFRSNIRIRTRFLSALLRIADECDITENRVPEILYYNLNPKGASEEEFRKHLNIIGIGQPEPYKLQINGVARDPKGVEVLEAVRKRIQDELNGVKTILAKEDVVLDFVELSVDTRGFINRPIEFVLDHEKIVKLLIGENLYRRFDAGIRELLQNSIDACRLRYSLEKDYSPHIIFSFSKERISIEDNGIGMSFDTARQYLSNVGASFFVSKEFEDIKAGKVLFDPISRFGIGILSCFLIASEVEIETMKKNQDPCRFIIKDLNEGWRYEASSRKEVGTRISLYLNERGRKLSLEKALQHYAKAVKIPIQIINENTGEKKTLQQQWNNNMQEIKQTRYISTGERVDKPLLSQTVTTNGVEATYYYYGDRTSFGSAQFFFSNQGVFVGRNATVCELPSSGLFVLVNCTRNLVDLAVSREAFVRNERFNDFLKSLYENFFVFVNDQFVETVKDKKLSDFDDCIEFARICQKFFSSYISIDPRSYSLKEQEIILDFLLSLTYPTFSAKGLRLMKGESIFSGEVEKKIYDYSLPIKESLYHIESVEPILNEVLGESGTNIVVFNPLSTLLFHTSSPSAESRPFEFLCKQRNIQYEHLDVLKLLAQKKFKRTPTPLDKLLPESSFFAEMPKRFRSIVVNSNPFDFVEDAGIKTYAYQFLCLRELLPSDSFLVKTLSGQLKDELESIDAKRLRQKKTPTEFVFDTMDPVIESMLERSKFILSDKSVRQIVREYFRYLPVVFMQPFFPYVSKEYTIDLVTALERVIGCLLKKTYKPIPERIGKLGLSLMPSYR